MIRSSRCATAEPVVVPFTIAIDTREGAPWSFEGLLADSDQQRRPLLISAQRQTLQTGDYSIVGREHEITIERKSLEDLYSTLAGGRDRFQREHERMMAMVQAGGYACVIVEDDLRGGLLQPPMHTNYPPKSMFRTFIKWSMRYNVPWHWAGARSLAEVLAFRLLQSWHIYKEQDAL
jgi:ERCC4-type nuclease